MADNLEVKVSDDQLNVSITDSDSLAVNIDDGQPLGIQIVDDNINAPLQDDNITVEQTEEALTVETKEDSLSVDMESVVIIRQVVEDEVPLAKRVDFENNDTLIYRGEAAVGSAVLH